MRSKSPAVELAAFFQMLLDGGEYQGKRYLKQETVALAARSHYKGYDSNVKNDMSWGFGLIMGDGEKRVQDPREWPMGYNTHDDTFAGFGIGTSMVWADPKTRLVTAFTCNGLLKDPEVSLRWAVISNAVWDCLI